MNRSIIIKLNISVIIKFFLFFAILGVGYGGYVLLVSFKKEPEKKPASDHVIIVSVEKAQLENRNIAVPAMGTVIPARSVTLFPQVGGKIIYQNTDLISGGFLKKGEKILTIDPRDYDLTIKQQRANVQRAKMELATEKAMGQVAEKEWDLLKDEAKPEGDAKDLSLRKIQLNTAKAALESAKSALMMANLNRERTIIRAPFDCLVTEEFVDIGQIISPNIKIATLVDSKEFHIRVSVRVDDLKWIKFPGSQSKKNGAKVTVFLNRNTKSEVKKEGRVIKLISSLEKIGKMAQLLVSVTNDFTTVSASKEKQPLLLGSYVNVEIEGPYLKGLIKIPRHALGEQNTVLLNKNGHLAIKTVNVLWSTAGHVFVKGEINDNDEVVVSRITAPVEGMKLKTGITK